LPEDCGSALCNAASARGVVPGRSVKIVTSYGIAASFHGAERDNLLDNEKG
jgi:hypothetical protein